MKILGIPGSVAGTKTLNAVATVLDHIQEADDKTETELLNLSQYAIVFADGRDYRDYDSDTQVIIDKIMSADGFVIGTPTYQGSIPGVLKNIFDLLPVNALQDKVVGILATAGTDKHFLMVEHQLKPLLHYMKAVVIPQYVFINEAQFINNHVANDEIGFRLKRLADDTLGMVGIVQRFIEQRDNAFDF